MPIPSTLWPQSSHSDTSPRFPPALHRLLKRKNDELDEDDEYPDVPAAKYRCPCPSPSPPSIQYVSPPAPVPRKRTGKGWRDIEREHKEREEKERRARIAEAIAQGADPMVVDPPPKPSLLVFVGQQIAARSRFLQQQRAQAQAEAQAQAAPCRPVPAAPAHQQIQAQQPAALLPPLGQSHTHAQALTKAQADALAMPPPPLPLPASRTRVPQTAPAPPPFPQPAMRPPRPWPPYEHDFDQMRYDMLRRKKLAALPSKPGDMLKMRPWTPPGPSPLRQSGVARPDGSFPLPEPEDQIMVDDFSTSASASTSASGITHAVPSTGSALCAPATKPHMLKVHKIERLNTPMPPLRPQLLFRRALDWLCSEAVPAQIAPAHYACLARIWTAVVKTGPPIYWYQNPQPPPPPRGTPGSSSPSAVPTAAQDRNPRTGRLLSAAEKSERNEGAGLGALRYEVVRPDPLAHLGWVRFREQFRREVVLRGERVSVRPDEKSLVRWMVAGMKLRSVLKAQKMLAEGRKPGRA
ncbi:hypothetical protein C8Q80DRAFT_1344088 [Daedaleopsis nitida]|nr:hypothetical protein C8Q80DRAFT_1344088 [Daedaleopsis nitida]